TPRRESPFGWSPPGPTAPARPSVASRGHRRAPTPHRPAPPASRATSPSRSTCVAPRWRIPSLAPPPPGWHARRSAPDAARSHTPTRSPRLLTAAPHRSHVRLSATPRGSRRALLPPRTPPPPPPRVPGGDQQVTAVGAFRGQLQLPPMRAPPGPLGGPPARQHPRLDPRRALPFGA